MYDYLRYIGGGGGVEWRGVYSSKKFCYWSIGKLVHGRLSFVRKLAILYIHDYFSTQLSTLHRIRAKQKLTVTK